jgi:hypothetical protein
MRLRKHLPLALFQIDHGFEGCVFREQLLGGGWKYLVNWPMSKLLMILMMISGVARFVFAKIHPNESC